MPIYTYECTEGHRWDEHRATAEGSEISEGLCPSCPSSEDGGPQYGTKVPATFSVSLKGRGFTPTHYPNRKENK